MGDNRAIFAAASAAAKAADYLAGLQPALQQGAAA
jgi:antirestriction protein ArdC